MNVSNHIKEMRVTIQCHNRDEYNKVVEQVRKIFEG